MRLIRLYLSLILVLLSRILSAQEQQFNYTLVNTVDGIRISFEKSNGLERAISFSINSTNVYAKVSCYATDNPIIEANDIYTFPSNQQFQFKDGKTYKFIIHNIEQELKFIRPQRLIYSLVVDNPSNGYQKLDSLYNHFDNFIKIASDSKKRMFPQYSIGTFIKAIGYNRETVLNTFKNFKKQVNDNDIFVFYFNGHGDTTVVSKDTTYNLVLDGGELFSAKDLIQQLDSLPETSPKIVILSTCFSGIFAKELYDSKLKNTTLLFAGPKKVNEGAFSRELNTILSKSYSNGFALDNLIDSIKKNETLQSISAGCFQTKDCTNPLIFKEDSKGQDYSESWLPYSLDPITKTFSIGVTPDEKAAFISEAAFLTSAIGFGISAQMMWTKGKESQAQNLYTGDYIKAGKLCAYGFGISCVGFVGSYLWHQSAVKKRLKSQNSLSSSSPLTSISVYPTVGKNSASLGAVITF